MVTASLVNDKIKINALSDFDEIIVNNELINKQLFYTSQKLGFTNIEDFKIFLEIEEYDFSDFREKVLLELKWNQ